MSRTAHAWGLLLVCLLSAAATRARADIAVAAHECAQLDPSELRARVELEIGDVAAEWSEPARPHVSLTCTDDGVRIEISDPVTAKSVARRIAMPTVERERVLALAIAQLFLTSWLELLVDDEDAGPGAEAAERHARAAVEAAARRSNPETETETEETENHETETETEETENHETETEETENPETETEETETSEPETEETEALDLKLELTLDAGARLRTEGEQLVTAAAALRAVLVVDGSLLVGLGALFEWGRALRQRGTIHLYGGSLGLVAGWRTPELGPFSLDVVGVASLQALAFDGHPSRPGVIGGTTVAIAFEGGLELAPSLRAGPLRISLPLALSGIGFAPEGKVTGEAPLVVGGPVFSAFLRISVAASL